MRRSEPSVLVRLQGGLGNQLFQYAAGLSVAGGCRQRVQIVDVEDAHPLLEDLLSHRLNAAPAAWSPPQILPTIVRRSMRRLDRARWSYRETQVRIDQLPRNAFDPMVDTVDELSIHAVLLNGYFQHPSWYRPALEDVAQRVHAFVRKRPEYALGAGSTVISFRRGDYVRYGWDLSMDYYAQALDRLLPDAGPTLIVGDDQVLNALAAQWFRSRGFDATPAPNTTASPEVRDACLLASARCVVMSNSTFCWWAVAAREHAGESDRQYVLAPDRWMPFLSTNPLLSPTWISIPTTFSSEPAPRTLQSVVPASPRPVSLELSVREELAGSARSGRSAHAPSGTAHEGAS